MGVKLSRELIRAAHRGNRPAYNKVGEWMAEELVAFYKGRGREGDEIAELSQVAALRIVEKFSDAPEDPQAFRAWTIGFARMISKEHITRRQRREGKCALVRVQPRTPARRPDSALFVRRLLAWVRTELNKLPTPYRRTFGLMLVGDKRRDVAEELNVPEGTVRRRVWWVRRRLDGARDRSRRTSPRYRT